MNSLEVSCQETAEKLKQGETFLLLDCREQDEYDHVHIAGATLLPMSQIADRVQELEPQRDQPVIVYCHHGGRSLRVTMFLKQAGFADVRSMAGGIDAWASEIDPSIPRY